MVSATRLEKKTMKKNKRKTHLAQRMSMRRNGLRQSRVNALDTMLAVRGSGSLEVKNQEQKKRFNAE